MTRDISSAMQAAVARQKADVVWLLEINASGGVTRICTAGMDLEWDGETWEAVGGLLELGKIEESDDPRSRGSRISLSGVNSAIIGLLLNNDLRGREASIYLAHLDDGDVEAVEPLLTGLLNDRWEVDTTSPKEDAPGSVEVSTRITSILVLNNRDREVRCNVDSHNAMLERLGVTISHSTRDLFFRHVPGLQNKTFYWGAENPTRLKGSGGGGDGEPDPHDTRFRP